MPAVPLTEKCLKCSARRNECLGECIESPRITAIFDLCYDFSTPGYRPIPCRHIEACTQDPRTCGYWTDREYPIEI